MLKNIFLTMSLMVAAIFMSTAFANTPVVNGTPVSGSCVTGASGWHESGRDGCTIKFYGNPMPHQCLFIYDAVLSNASASYANVQLIAGKQEQYNKTIAIFTLDSGASISEHFNSPFIVGSARGDWHWDGNLDVSIDEAPTPTSFTVTGLVGTCPDSSDLRWFMPHFPN